MASNDPRSDLTYLRRMVVFDRFLARLLNAAPTGWVLKGAVALDFRFGSDARLTRDLDIGRVDGLGDWTNDLARAAKLDLGDYFEFRVLQSSPINDQEALVAARYSIFAELDERRFEIVTMDVGLGGPLIDPPDLLMSPPLLSFAGIEPVALPTLHLNQHVAEKLQAYVRTYRDGRRSTRIKDLVDLVLISERSTFELDRLKSTLTSTFAHRAIVDLPTLLPDPPNDWEVGFANLAGEIGLNPDVIAAHRTVATFLNPVLDGSAASGSMWNPTLREWTS
jgi:hypothetical protein